MESVSENIDGKPVGHKSKTYLRHRVQSYVIGGSPDGEEYETTIPAEAEAEFIDNETVKVAEEVIEVSNITRGLLAETVLGYIWWSLIHAVAAMIWFYPLNELELTGYEAFAVVLLSPLLMQLSFVSRLISSPLGLALTRFCALVGVISFHAPATLSRLILLMFGCGSAMLWLCGAWWSPSPRERTLSFWGIILGYFVMLALRIAYVSLNPVWWSPTFNTLTFVVGAIMTVSQSFFISGHISTLKPKEDAGHVVKWHQWLRISMGFAALFWLTHWVFGEVSLVSRWVVEGAPQTGPSPNPWGVGVFLALGIGVFLSTKEWTGSLLWWFIGCIGAALLLYSPKYWGYAGGLILASYVMSIWPLMADKLVCCPPGLALPVVMVLYIVLMLASVWVVAFNFVPGGEYARERTNFLLAVTMSLIGIGIYTDRPLQVQPKELDKMQNDKSADFTDSVLKTKRSSKRGWKMAFLKLHGDRFLFFKTYVKIVLLFVLISGCSAMLLRYKNFNYNTPDRGNNAVKFTAAVWTVHFGYDNQGWPSYERAAVMLNETGADVIGLLESDCSRPFLGNNDLTIWLAERLGMYSDFGPSTRDHTWGALLLSRYPIVKSSHYLLPSPEGELAPALSATVNVSGHLVDYIVVHMGNDRDNLDRKLQAEELARIMNASNNPVVFLGYVTSAPGSRDYHTLLDKGRTKDIDSSDGDRWCEYIMYRGLIRQGYARISHAGLSDTEVQIARFLIPDDLNNYSDNDRISTRPDDLPETMVFTKRFGSFYRGHYHPWNHHYHMSTPKYFLPS